MRRVSLVSKFSSVALAVGTVVAGLALATPSANADFTNTLPSQNPIDYTPRVLNNADNLPNSQARSIARVGNRIVIGGNFRQIQNAPPNGTQTFDQRALFSFDANTGAIDQNFFPEFNGDVTTVLAHPDGNKVYVAGNFSRVNGEVHSRVVLLNINNGNAISTFDPPAISAEVTSMKLANGRLYIGGDFATIGGTTRRALATLDPVTGALTDHIQSDIAGTLHGEGVPSVKAFDLTPNGKRLVAIGNFNQVDGQSRVQIAMWDTSTPVATLRNWGTQRYGNSCNQVFPTYMRDIDFAPNGKYFVVVTTGSFRFGTLCDTAARWELKGSGVNRMPNWVTYSGGDTFTSVEVTGPMAYLGGHFRWLNNPYKGDAAGTGAWPTEGLATVDTRNGLPFSWNPGRDRGLGVFDFLPTDSMLWSVSDTNNWANEYHPRLAGFPLFNNVLPPDRLGRIPGDVWQLGAIPGGGASDQRGIGFDGTTVENQLTEPGDRNWSTVRGAFAVDNTVYTAWSDNTFTAQAWDGSSFGASQDIDLYEGTTATPGFPNNFFNDLDNITGMFYDRARARLYYTMQGSNQLFWRPFTPESRVVGATRRVLANDGPLPPAQVKGMFLAGKRLFFADNTTGALKRVKWAGTKITGKAVVVNNQIDWRSNALFLSSQWAQLADNVAPVAKLTTNCTGLDCTVNASKSSDADGGIVDYTVDYGDGVVTSGPDAVTEHEYPGTGTFDITVTVKDNRGLTANATTQVSVVQPPNVNPTAAFAFSCWGLDCNFDATTSEDPDGTIVAYDWDFGDSKPGTGSMPNHVYDNGGTYDVTLTVTDNRGGTNSVTHQLSANPIPTTVAFRDAVSVDGGGNSGVSIQVPNSVQNGDLMLLFVTNGADRTPDTPANWTALGSRTDAELRTHVFWRFANATSAGSTVTSTLRDDTSAAKGAPEVTSLVAYSGVASPPVSAWDGRVETSTSPVTGHATPGITVPDPGAWVVSYWADRTNSGAGSTPTSAWTPPLDQVFRGNAFNTGTTPRVSSLLTDDGGPVLAGARTGRTASADVTAEKATMFTIVLASQ